LDCRAVPATPAADRGLLTLLTKRARAAVVALVLALPATVVAAVELTTGAAAATAQRPGPAAQHPNVARPHSQQVERMLAGQAGRAMASRAAAGAAPPSGASAVQGVDVSSFQHSPTVGITWPAVASAGYKFAFVKAAEGNYYTNPYAAGDLAGASAAGLYVAPYDFAIPNVSGAAVQADFALDHSGLAPGSQSLPMILDIEYDPNTKSDHANECYNLSQAQLVAWIKAWIAEIVRRTGQQPAIYSTADWWTSCTGNSADFGADPLWIAYQGTGSPTVLAGWTGWNYWQYTSTGTVSGIPSPGNTDLSYLSASALQLLDPPAQSYPAGATVHVQAGALTAQTVTFSAAGLPAGLAISPAGQITGTLPAGAGTFQPQVTATAGSTTATQSFGWDIHGAIALRRPAAQSGTVGAPVSLQVAATDGLSGCTLRFSAAGLPPGLTMGGCGKITGWLRTGGHRQVQVTASDSTGTLATTTFGWSVASARNAGPTGLVRLSRYRCLDAGSGATVVAGTCTGSRAGKWVVAADGTLRLRGNCLSEAASSGSTVTIATCSRGAVRWQLGGGTGSLPSGLTNLTSGLCLTDTSSKSGARVGAMKCSGSTAQRWTLPAGPVSSGVPGYCLSDYHSRGPVTQQVNVRWCTGSASQTWTVQPGGHLQIGAFCLTPAAGAAAVAGGHVVLAGCGTSASQNWQLYGGPMGGWLVNSAAGLCLSDPADRAKSGSALVLGYCQLADPGVSWRVS
jgi:GH25 family lysozyme M1 (1,4-beta-N-acetylmuramidase)